MAALAKERRCDPERAGDVFALRTGAVGAVGAIQLIEGPELVKQVDGEKAQIAGADGTCTKMYTNLENNWHRRQVDVQFRRREIADGRWAEK